MEFNNHKGSELNNVQETWNENEKLRAEEQKAAANDNQPPEAAKPVTTLDKIIQEEAKEYDEENREDRLLGGDRASVNDTESGQ